jgi:hypothetical protein
MKDFSEEQYRSGGQPKVDGDSPLGYALKTLFNDTSKLSTDFVVEGLTYEELIGLLLGVEGRES